MIGIVVPYAAFLIAIAAYDARHQRIPNVAVYPAIVAAVGLAFVRPDGPWWSFIAAGAAAIAVFVGLALASRGGMGMGDAKLAAFIGLMAGWPAVLVAGFVAFAVGAVVGVLLVVVGRLGRREPVPFAPALAVGALTAAVAGRELASMLWPGVVG
jgi:prepilin signal peptidase PulO-like enzyme (type II secretory pathway)